jgi:hypothetical protein
MYRNVNLNIHYFTDHLGREHFQDMSATYQALRNVAEFTILLAVVMKVSIFWYIAPYSPHIHKSFGDEIVASNFPAAC